MQLFDIITESSRRTATGIVDARISAAAEIHSGASLVTIENPQTGYSEVWMPDEEGDPAAVA
jgi:hypothetical protein